MYALGFLILFYKDISVKNEKKTYPDYDWHPDCDWTSHNILKVCKDYRIDLNASIA
jgi:hypothetical protein